MSVNADRAVRVLTVGDQAIFRVAARDVIDATPGFEALADVASGAEALRVSAALEPDLVLMDVRMPGMDGIEAARRLSVARPSAMLRKQDFCPATLQRVWELHRRA